MENKKVLLGMSGGVDSSVSALLLKQNGYDPIGMTLELFAGSSCCNISTYIDAKNVCNSIGIPHITDDCKKLFKKCVIQDFIDCYSNCKTPNPCIECNKYMKFGYMWEKAKELGCEYIATGHYAKTEYSEKYGRLVLKKSNAGKKDQSYVLWNIPKELIEHVLFPLSDFEDKEQIREIARENKAILLFVIFFVAPYTKGKVPIPNNNDNVLIATSLSPNNFIQKWSKKKYKGVCCKSKCNKLSIVPIGKDCFAVNQEQASSYQISVCKYNNLNTIPAIKITANIEIFIIFFLSIIKHIPLF